MIKPILRKILPWKARVFLRRILYFGLKFKCSVCRSRVRCFLPAGYEIPVLEELDVIGSKYRAEDTCPVCFSHSRTRLVHHYLLKEMNINTLHLRLLHVAPEFGIYLSIHNISNIDYTPADFSPRRYANTIPIEQMDITQISHSSNSFDSIICNHVLEHIQNDRLAMAELLRVLEPGGWAILQVPVSRKLKQTFEDHNIIDPTEREHYFGQKDHVRIYAMDYVERLTSVGFSVEVFDPLVHWGGETIEALRLNPEEKIFIAHKNKDGNVHQ
jgi:SAM-dependent methyltransferase